MHRKSGEDNRDDNANNGAVLVPRMDIVSRTFSASATRGRMMMNVVKPKARQSDEGTMQSIVSRVQMLNLIKKNSRRRIWI